MEDENIQVKLLWHHHHHHHHHDHLSLQPLEELQFFALWVQVLSDVLLREIFGLGVVKDDSQVECTSTYIYNSVCIHIQVFVCLHIYIFT